MINQDKIFNETIKEIQKQFGKNTIMTLTNDPDLEGSIPTGSVHLDKALGVGGYPKNRIIEIYGNESSGKSTIALQAVASAQKLNYQCAYIDVENSLDKQYCEINGVDTEKLIVAQPEHAEQAFSIIEALIKTDMVDLIIIDSVAALVPSVELNNKFEDQNMGLQARIMSKGLRIIQNLLMKHSCTIIFINQLREKIGVMFGNNETTTGGRALKFFASVRIELKRQELIKKDNECVGIRSVAKIIKNKVAPPLKKATIDIYFDQGIDHGLEIIEFALEKNLIIRKGAYYYYEENKLAQGKEDLKIHLLNNPELFKKIKDQALAYINDDETIKQELRES